MAIQTVADLVARSTTSSPTVTSGQYRQERENVMASIGLEKAKPPVAAVSANPPKMYFEQAQTSTPEVKPQGQGQSPFSGSNIAPPRTDYATGISDAERSRTGMGAQVTAESRTNDVLGLVRQGLSNPQELQRYLNVNQAGGVASGYTEAEIARIIQENQKAVQEGQQYRQQAIAGGATPQTLEQNAMSEIDAIQKRREQSFNAQQEYLNRQFDQQSQATQAAQKSEAGSTNLQLARMGAFTAASGVSYGNSLAEKQRRELSDLETKRMGALQAAQDAYDQDSLQIAYKKLDEARAVKKEQADARAAQLDEMKKYEELRKYERDNASDFFKGLVAGGKEFSDIPSDYLETMFPSLDKAAAQAMFSIHADERNVKALDEEIKAMTLEEKKFAMEDRPLDRQKKLMDIQSAAQTYAKNTLSQIDSLRTTMEKWPKGVPLQIGDASFMGIDGGAIFESAGDGMGRLLYKDPTTGKDAVMSMEFVGNPEDLVTVYQNGVPILVNKKTQQQTPITRGVPGQFPDAAMSWEKYFPTDAVGGQCGEFVHKLITDYPYGLNTLAQKKAVMNVSKSEVPRVGDAVIQNIGGDSGHIAVVNWVGTGTDGQPLLKLTESNLKLDEKITNGRPLSANDPSIQGYFRGNLRPELRTGTDLPRPTQAQETAPQDTTKPLTFSPSPFTTGRQTEAQFNAANEKEQSAREAAELVSGRSATFEEATKGLSGSVINRTRKILSENNVDITAKTNQIDVPDFNTFARNLEREAVKSGTNNMMNPKQLEELYNRNVKPIPAYTAAAEQIALDLTGDKKGPQFIADIKKLVESGDLSRAKDRLKKVALDTVDPTTAQQTRGRDATMRALKNIETDLETYRAKYKDMNILSGTAEQIKNKIGKVQNADQKRIATKIQAAVADYRKAISGAAFTEQEKAEYDAMFPSIMNEESLNTANIQAMMETFAQANESFYRQQFGNENYELIFQP